MINHAWRAWNGPRLHPLLALCLTSISVEVAWVFFRAPGLHSAIGVLSSMAGLHGIVPDRMTPILGDLNRIGSVLLLVPVVWLAPNSQEIVGIVKSGSLLRWRPSLAWGVVAAAVACACFARLGAPTAFLYYQF
jgi:alginate O-acetyltransferase complex protein AlgI